MKHNLILFIICLGLPLLASAQGIDIKLENRFSFAAMPENSYGFQGDYVNIRINGSINENLTYSFHHRLKNSFSASNPFGATDWVYLLYRRGNWGIQAGKMQLEYGGYEYDEAPINVYYSSKFYDNMAGCFQFGLSLIYYLGDSNKFTIQVTPSPLPADRWGGNMAYNFCAKGTAGFYGWKHSVNLFDIPGGGHLGSISLGNCFTAGPAKLELDLVQRGNMKTFKMFDDCAVIANLVVAPTDWMNVIAKASYDCNFSQYDPLVPEFGEYWSYGGGFEFFPKKGDKDIRIHAMYYYFNQPTLLLGLTWKIHLLTR